MSMRKNQKIKTNRSVAENVIKKDNCMCIKQLPFKRPNFHQNIARNKDNYSISGLITWFKSLDDKIRSDLFTLSLNEDERLSSAIDIFAVHLVTVRDSRNKLKWLYESKSNKHDLKSIDDRFSYRCCASCGVLYDYILSYQLMNSSQEKQLIQQIQMTSEVLKATCRYIALPGNIDSLHLMFRLVGEAAVSHMMSSSLKHQDAADAIEGKSNMIACDIDIQVFTFGQLICRSFLAGILQVYHRYAMLNFMSPYLPQHRININIDSTRNMIISVLYPKKGCDMKILIQSMKHVMKELAAHPDAMMKAIYETTCRRHDVAKEKIMVIRSNPCFLRLWMISYLSTTTSCIARDRNDAISIDDVFDHMIRLPMVEVFTPINDIKSLLLKHILTLAGEKIAQQLIVEDEARIAAVAAANATAMLKKAAKNKKKKLRQKQHQRQQLPSSSSSSSACLINDTSSSSNHMLDMSDDHEYASVDDYETDSLSITGSMCHSISVIYEGDEGECDGDDSDCSIDGDHLIQLGPAVDSKPISEELTSLEVLGDNYELKHHQPLSSDKDEDRGNDSAADVIDVHVHEQLSINDDIPAIVNDHSFNILSEATDTEMRMASQHFIPWLYHADTSSSPYYSIPNHDYHNIHMHHPHILSYPPIHVDGYPHAHPHISDAHYKDDDSHPWYPPYGNVDHSIGYPLSASPHDSYDEHRMSYYNPIDNHNIESPLFAFEAFDNDDSAMSVDMDTIHDTVDVDHDDILPENHVSPEPSPELPIIAEIKEPIAHHHQQDHASPPSSPISSSEIHVSHINKHTPPVKSNPPSIISSNDHLHARIVKLELRNLMSEASRAVLINKLALYDSVIQDIASQKIHQQQPSYLPSSMHHHSHRHHIFPHPHPNVINIPIALHTPIKHHQDDNIRSSYVSPADIPTLFNIQQHLNRSSTNHYHTSGPTFSSQHPMQVFASQSATAMPPSSSSTPSSTSAVPVPMPVSVYVSSDAVSEDGDRQETMSRARNASVGHNMDSRSYSSAGKQLSVRALLPLRPLGNHNLTSSSAASSSHISTATSANAILHHSSSSASLLHHSSNTNMDVEDGLEALLITGIHVPHDTFPTAHQHHSRPSNNTATPIRPRILSTSRPTSAKEYYSSSAFLDEKYMQSSLSHDIARFVQLIDKSELSLRRAKTEAFNRLRAIVKSLWPRSQVKLFGSYMSGLSLPSSDLDLVICLPKVHVEAGPDLPGVLEGRNSVKETWQQNLYRCLCKEDWVHTESIKVIGNTMIPVLKLKTRQRDDHKNMMPSISLDISFEGPGHKGLDANKLTASIIKKYAPIRPLVLVLKFFLSQRRLCEAYTGGLSSYAIFLLITRFLQELEVVSASTMSSTTSPELQVSDLGALLLGLLRFYGDDYDPRTTGVSVLRRCYFPRSVASHDHRTHPTPASYATSASPASHHIPVLSDQQQVVSAARMLNASDRRHSFHAGRFHANIQHGSSSSSLSSSFEPYKFDPICIDDPLEVGNNVGRNCFRILQVQRCLSEVASTVDADMKAYHHSNTSSIVSPTSTNHDVSAVDDIQKVIGNHTIAQHCSLRLILGEEYEKHLMC